MFKNGKSNLVERVMVLLREDHGQSGIMIEEAIEKLQAHYATVYKIFRYFHKNGISNIDLVDGSGHRPKHKHKLNPEFQEGDSWKALIKGIWENGKKGNPKKATRIATDPKKLSLPTPDAGDLTMIARMAEASATVNMLTAKRKRLFNALPMIDSIEDLEDQTRLIKQTDRELKEAATSFNELQSETLGELQDRGFAEKFLELTLYLYAQSLEVETLTTANKELTGERDQSLQDNNDLANELANLELRYRGEQQRKVPFDSSGIQITRSHA